MSKIALFPGSFDPPTLGHLDIICRASKLCDRLFVAIAINSEKGKGLFSPAERKGMLDELTKEIPNVETIVFNGLVIDLAKDKGIDFLVRGLRPFSDFDHEFQMAIANRKMTGIETVFLMADQAHFHISATRVREIGGFGRRLKGFVPDEIEEIVYQRLSKSIS